MVLLYIMIFFNFSQPEANYTIECIILMYTLIAIHIVYSYEVYFQTFYDSCSHCYIGEHSIDKHSLQTGLSSFMPQVKLLILCLSWEATQTKYLHLQKFHYWLPIDFVYQTFHYCVHYRVRNGRVYYGF